MNLKSRPLHILEILTGALPTDAVRDAKPNTDVLRLLSMSELCSNVPS